MSSTKKSLIQRIISRYQEPPITDLITLWGIFLLSLSLIIYYAHWELGILGDAMSGIFGTLISAMTLIFVAFSFQSQQTALKTQKEELEATKIESAKQSELIKKERFESTFFQLLERQEKLIEYFQWGDKKGYDALYIQENTFEHDIEFFGRKNSPPLQEYIKNYIKINEVIINLIENTFDSFKDRFMYYDILNSLQSEIIKEMIYSYYRFTGNQYYLDLIESYTKSDTKF